VELKEIKTIINLMIQNGLTEFELEKDNVKLRIRRGPEGVTHSLTSLAHKNGGNGIPAQPASVSNVPVSSPSSSASPPPATEFKEIKSPMVGTFYRSPSPETPPYIEIGQSVTEETVVCIIEAMKVMNEIKAEMRGVITDVLLENAKPVEFGKPLFKVKLS